jgi:hypothetical protein
MAGLAERFELTDALVDAEDDDYNADVWLSFDDVLLDDYSEEIDGDDSLIAQHMLDGHEHYFWEAAPAPRTAPPPRHARRRRVAPFVRDLKRGSRGKDVKAVQLALRNFYRAKKLGKGPAPTGFFGVGTRRALKEFQRRRGLERDGVYGIKSHRHLSAHMGPTALKLMVEAKSKAEKKGPKGMRARIVATAMYAYNHAAWRMNYTQGSLRDDWLWNRCRPPCTPSYADCSSFAEWCYWVAGAPHPSGWAWRAIGWTGSQITKGRRYSSNPQVGDLAFYYGGSGIGHVTVVVSSTRCVSFGSEPIRLLSIWYRRVAYFHSYI